jgi:ribonucleoside-triphosphate reductase
LYENISSSEIRRQVEEALMTINKKVAKSYIQAYDDNRDLLKKQDFIKDYILASNAATGSKFDANANVTNKNIVTLGQELYKENNIKQNRYILKNKIKILYTKKLADQYIADLESHVLYKHDESGTPGYPYCVAITMFPFLTDGLTKLGGVSVAPTDLKSYCGEFINLVYSVSSQFMGAVATPEFLMYMDYFIRKDYGDNYLERLDEVVENTTKQRTLLKVIENCFQQVVHSMNMPAGNRGYQTVFWNVGYFDKPYFEGVFGEFVFPDGTKPKWETLSWLQKHFMKWFNNERSKYILTFPVETMALLTDGSDDFADKEYADFTAQMWADGHSFFCYLSDSPDSLSSCCRLRNSLKDNQDDEHNHTTHQYSMGTASVATGSKSVMSVNLPRLIQLAVERYYNEKGIEYKRGTQITGISEETRKEMYEYIKQDVYDMTERIHKYQTAFNETIKDFFKAGMLDVYNAGFIDMKKQYLTVGVNGITDAAEYMGLNVGNNEDYRVFVNNILETINICNKKDRTRECMFNTEFVPAENLAAKNYKWDKNDGFWVSPNRNLYSSYFYNPEDTQLTVIDKMKLHGKNYVQYLDGGSALHANLQEHLTQPQYRQLMKVAAKNGCNYFTFNVRNSVCNECGYISKHTIHKCPKCGSTNIDYLTRVIGYLKRISSFSEARQIEAAKRNYMTE